MLTSYRPGWTALTPSVLNDGGTFGMLSPLSAYSTMSLFYTRRKSTKNAATSPAGGAKRCIAAQTAAICLNRMFHPRRGNSTAAI
jgi:hypothetical protein